MVTKTKLFVVDFRIGTRDDFYLKRSVAGATKNMLQVRTNGKLDIRNLKEIVSRKD